MQVGYVLLNCDLGAEEYVVEELRQIPEVKNAYLILGAYDVIVELNTISQEDFEKTVSSKIRNLHRIVSTTMLNVVNPE